MSRETKHLGGCDEKANEGSARDSRSACHASSPQASAVHPWRLVGLQGTCAVWPTRATSHFGRSIERKVDRAILAPAGTAFSACTRRLPHHPLRPHRDRVISGAPEKRPASAAGRIQLKQLDDGVAPCHQPERLCAVDSAFPTDTRGNPLTFSSPPLGAFSTRARQVCLGVPLRRSSASLLGLPGQRGFSRVCEVTNG